MDLDRMVVSESYVRGLEELVATQQGKLRYLREQARQIDWKFETDPDFDRQYALEMLIAAITRATEA